jgi:hypothetical protein
MGNRTGSLIHRAEGEEEEAGEGEKEDEIFKTSADRNLT